jgi:hypothetical protein
MDPTRILIALLATGVSVAACSSSSSGASRGAGSSGATSARNGGPQRFAGGPAAAGKIAALSGTTMQVQNEQTGQVAVTWTRKTTFSHTVTEKASAIKAGSCVTAIGVSGTARTATTFTAATVLVTPARNGSCTGGFRNGAGGTGAPGGVRSGGPRSGFPSGRSFPSGVPSGAPRSGVRTGQFGAIASGKVTAVTGSTLTIAATDFGSSRTTTKTVKLAANTKTSTQAATTSKSLAVGECVTAQGKADTTGAVAATRVEISEPTNGQCNTGFFRPGGGTGG